MTHPEIIQIRHVDWLGGYRLRIIFDDGKVQEVDFGPFLQASHHPSIRAYLDPVRFAAFRLVYGELVWDDYALCFPMMDLYNNSLLPQREHLSAA